MESKKKTKKKKKKKKYWIISREAVLTSTHDLCYEQKYEKYQSFFIWKFSVFGGEIFNIFELACFRNVCGRAYERPENRSQPMDVANVHAGENLRIVCYV